MTIQITDFGDFIKILMDEQEVLFHKNITEFRQDGDVFIFRDGKTEKHFNYQFITVPSEQNKEELIATIKSFLPEEHLDTFKELGDSITEGGGLPYLVYTALLTQSGDGTSGLLGGELEIGKRYEITVYNGEDDFINVGALVNETGEVFIATGTTPTSWEEESVLTDTSAPVATILENTIGATITYIYDSPGVYYAISDINLFQSPNEPVTITGSYSSGGDLTILQVVPVQENVVEILSSLNGAFTNDILGGYPCVFEIKIYN